MPAPRKSAAARATARAKLQSYPLSNFPVERQLSRQPSRQPPRPPARQLARQQSNLERTPWQTYATAPLWVPALAAYAIVRRVGAGVLKVGTAVKREWEFDAILRNAYRKRANATRR